MVVIRLSRTGAKNRPFYHIVAADSRNKRDGRYLERLGYYNPRFSGNDVELQIDLDRANHWIGLGAQLSQRVSKLVKTAQSPLGQEKEEELKATEATEAAPKKESVEATEATEAAPKEESVEATEKNQTN